MQTPTKQTIIEAAGEAAGLIGAHMADTQRQLDAETITRRTIAMESDVRRYFSEALKEAAIVKSLRDDGPALYDFCGYDDVFDAAVTRAQRLYTSAKHSGASKRALAVMAGWLDEILEWYADNLDFTRMFSKIYAGHLAQIREAVQEAIA